MENDMVVATANRNDHHNDGDETMVAHISCGIWYTSTPVSVSILYMQLDSLNTFTANALYTFVFSSLLLRINSTCATSTTQMHLIINSKSVSSFSLFLLFNFSIITGKYPLLWPFHSYNEYLTDSCNSHGANSLFFFPWFPNTAHSLSILFFFALAFYLFLLVFVFGSNRKWISIKSSFKFCTLRATRSNVCF